MRASRTADYRVLSPGDSTTFKIEMILGRKKDGSLFLGGSDGYGAVWQFFPEGPGEYGIQLKYRFLPKQDFRMPGFGATSIPVNPKHLAPLKFNSEILKVVIEDPKGVD